MRKVGPGRGISPLPTGADTLSEELRQTLRLEQPKGAAMPGSHATEIVVDFLESTEDWPDIVEDEAEPELDLPPLPPPRPKPA
jgi:hypothetical protein